MKKITLVLVMLLTLGLVAATAQEVAISPSFSGSATMTVGYNLDATTFGIVNAPAMELKLNIMAGGTAANEAPGGWYGDVQLAIGAVSAADNAISIADPTVTAKITNGSLYFQIWALDGFATGKVSPVENAGAGAGFPAESAAETDIKSDLADGSGGVTVGMANDMLDFKLYFATESGYAATDTPDDNGSFLVGTDVKLTAGPAVVELEAVKGIGVSGDELGIGAKVALDVSPLTAWVGADAQIVGTPSVTSFEVGAGASLAAAPLTAGLALAYSDNYNMDTEVTLALDLGDIDPSLLIGVYDIGVAAPDAMDWLAKLTLGYVMGSMTATIVTGYDSYGDLPLSITLAIADIIPKTSVTIAWASNSLVDASLDVTDGGGNAMQKGTATVALKVSY
jgi:hypothetical protein